MRRSVITGLLLNAVMILPVFAEAPNMIELACSRQSYAQYPSGTISRRGRFAAITQCANGDGVFRYSGPAAKGPRIQRDDCYSQSYRKFERFTLNPDKRFQMIDDCQRNGGVFRY